MGDTRRDPIDHYRTSLPHAGATFKDSLLLPGILFLGLSAAAIAVGLASAGYMRPMWAVTAAVAIIAAVLGVLWLVVERRRVNRIEAAGAGLPHKTTP